LSIKALELAPDHLKHEFTGWLNKKEFDASEKINAVLNIYNQLNIKELTQQKIETYFQKCSTEFAQISIEDYRKQSLHEISNSMLNRVY